MRVIVKGVIKLLQAVRSKRVEVMANPFAFDGVCDALEARALFLTNMFVRRKGKASHLVRRRLYGVNGNLGKGIRIVNGLAVGRNGKRVLKPNGEPWSAMDIAIEGASLRLRKAEKT